MEELFDIVDNLEITHSSGRSKKSDPFRMKIYNTANKLAKNQGFFIAAGLIDKKAPVAFLRHILSDIEEVQKRNQVEVYYTTSVKKDESGKILGYNIKRTV